MTSSPQNRSLVIVREIEDLRSRLRAWRQAHDRIALVPTMGALHAGHLALVADARRRANRVVASIFVNPTQFAPTEDFSTYPRTFEADRAKLEVAGCDMIWAPTVPVMYPAGFATKIHVEGPARGLETDFRPHFFAGVATVCTKLFTQVAPDVAIFGKKDYQQLLVVRQVARDLDLGLEIIGHPTVREADGLAMSSRNVYLSPADRKTAVALHATLQDMRAGMIAGVTATAAESRATPALQTLGFRVDYVAVRHALTLDAPSGQPGEPLRILAAAWLGATRLIDNIAA